MGSEVYAADLDLSYIQFSKHCIILTRDTALLIQSYDPNPHRFVFYYALIPTRDTKTQPGFSHVPPDPTKHFMWVHVIIYHLHQFLFFFVLLLLILFPLVLTLKILESMSKVLPLSSFCQTRGFCKLT